MCLQRCGIVATHLIHTRSQWRGTVIAMHDGILIAHKATLEVRAYRRYENQEKIVLGSMNAYLRRDAHEQRTDVKRGSALVSGDIFLVQAHYLLHHLNEEVGGNLWHNDATARALQARGIVFNAENAHLAVRTTISFQALEGFLTIMKAGGGHVHTDILIRANLYFAPLTIMVITTYIVVCGYITKRQTSPINILHNSKCVKCSCNIALQK